MLARTADNLYWMARYMERAENTARLLDVGYRMALLPDAGTGHRDEWRSTLITAGALDEFNNRYDEITTDNVLAHMVLNPDNPGSIYSCVRTARNNARAVRTALTKDMWESINATWLELKWYDPTRLTHDRAIELLEWVKERSMMFRGVISGTILRNDTYWFTELGAHIERADNTARILDVKYYVLLPERETVGGGIDYYQWTTILRSVSALRSYHWVYRDQYRPWKIAELLILRSEMPRSLHYCCNKLFEMLGAIALDYGARTEAQEMAGETTDLLASKDIDAIFQNGLHEFLIDFRVRNTALSESIARTYLLGS